VPLDSDARYHADFSLTQSREGGLDVDYAINVGEAAVAELINRIHGWRVDVNRLRKQLELNGAYAPSTGQGDP